MYDLSEVDLKYDTIVRCNTEKKAEALLDELNRRGYDVSDIKNSWSQYKEETCYGIGISSIEHGVSDPFYEGKVIDFDHLPGLLFDSNEKQIETEYTVDVYDLSEVQFKAGMAIHCDTEKKAKALLERLYISGFERMKSEDNWFYYKEKTYYKLRENNIVCGTIDDLDKSKIIEFDDLPGLGINQGGIEQEKDIQAEPTMIKKVIEEKQREINNIIASAHDIPVDKVEKAMSEWGQKANSNIVINETLSDEDVKNIADMWQTTKSSRDTLIIGYPDIPVSQENTIAELWSLYKGVEITAMDYKVMKTLMDFAIKNNL